MFTDAQIEILNNEDVDTHAGALYYRVYKLNNGEWEMYSGYSDGDQIDLELFPTLELLYAAMVKVKPIEKWRWR